MQAASGVNQQFYMIRAKAPKVTTAPDADSVTPFSRDDLNRLLDKLLMERALSEAAQA